VEILIDYLSRVANYNWWLVIVELFLIGVVVYWAIDFLEGTRGERLFRGVIFIIVAGVLILKLFVDQFELTRIEYLYEGFLLSVLIIAVAAFQPELRRALIRIGQPRFLISSSQQLARTAEEIISAVKDMSAAQTGAIIVIEKKVALGEFIETGVRLGASVSSELLKTIFRPGTALHDMAVVIRGDRIVAARVQLPLAEAGNVDGVELGSRHRAAIGISLGSDAIVIVVSEESGIISMAEQGELKRNVTEKELRKYLTSSIDKMSPPVEKLKSSAKNEQSA
jgi:diadenylate cyclase